MSYATVHTYQPQRQSIFLQSNDLRRNLDSQLRVINDNHQQFKDVFKTFDKQRDTYISTLTQRILTTPPPPESLNFEFPVQCKSSESASWGPMFSIMEADIPEDSIYRKILACIPLLGIIPTVINERSLATKIKTTLEPTRLIKLISVKNDYKIASIARILITVALIVSAAAYGVFSGMGLVTAILGCCLAVHAYSIHKNKQAIIRLQNGTVQRPFVR